MNIGMGKLVSKEEGWRGEADCVDQADIFNSDFLFRTVAGRPEATEIGVGLSLKPTRSSMLAILDDASTYHTSGSLFHYLLGDMVR